MMTSSSPVIVNIKNNDVKKFSDVNTITVGRNKTCSFDIPDPTISRTQCTLLLSEDNTWIIKDQSRHQSTLLNGKKILAEPAVIKSGDLISFHAYESGVFAFFYGNEDWSKKYKKRKFLKEDVPPPARKVPRLEVKDNVSSLSEDVNKQEVKLTAFNDTQVTCKVNSLSNVVNELEKYKSLYSNAIEDLQKETETRESVFIELTKEKKIKQDAIAELKKERSEKEYVHYKLIGFTKELKDVHTKAAERNASYSVLLKEKEMLKTKLQNHENIKEKMILKIQELTECLKESEQEQIRILNESQQSKSENEMINRYQHKLEKPEVTNGGGRNNVVTPEEIQDIVGMVEVEYRAEEIKQLNQEVLKKDDKITDLVHELEKHKQDVLDTVDREMLCTICSEVIYFAITLNCKHTFCKACICEWKKKKKECPVCRTKIRSEVHPLALDSFIDRLVDVIGGELKNRREAVKVERSRSALEVPSTSRGYGERRRSAELVNRPYRRSRRNIPAATSATSILHLPVSALPTIASRSSQVFIDLTGPGNGPYLNL